MQPKDANFIQLHIEKIVLAAAAIFAVVTIAYFVVLSPYNVEIRNKSVGPGEVEKLVENAAKRLDRALANPNSKIEQIRLPAYANDYQRRLGQSVTTMASLPIAPGNTGLDPASFPERLTPPDPYFLPRPPMPDNPIAAAGFGLLGQSEDRTLQQQFIQIIGDQEPRDFPYVSVEATFDMDKWVDRLQMPSTDRQRLPEQYWRNLLYIAGVFLQRQELDPVTGKWGNTKIIKTLPNQVAFREDTSRTYDAQTRDADAQLVTSNQGWITRTPFVPLARNGIWLPPSSAAKALTNEEQRELLDLRRKIRLLRTRIEALTETTRGGAGQPGQPPIRRGPGNDQNAQRLTALRADLFQAIQRRNELLGMNDGESLGPEDPMYAPGPGEFGPGAMNPMDPRMQDPRMQGQPGMFPGRPRPGMRPPTAPRPQDPRMQPSNTQPGMVDPATGLPVTQDRSVRVWAHDLTVEPGKTYRYRVIVSVLNPLFGRTWLSPEQQKANENRIALEPTQQDIQASPWSEPVTLDKRFYFFLTGGSAADQLARVEVWRIFDGNWIVEQFTENPGDFIGGVRTMVDGMGNAREVDMQLSDVVVDLVAREDGASLGRRMYLLYLDEDGQQIRVRTIAEDQRDPVRIRLQNEAALRAELAASSDDQPQDQPMMFER